ncbi:MAG: Flp pilus assembly complex ATPase component TadA, partial [Nitrospirae bacterium]|nr:Flp pilus assembly complex ATPase component TadA [Nitrospirota bacterium]
PKIQPKIIVPKTPPILKEKTDIKPKQGRNNILNLKQIGMDENQLTLFSKALKASNGLILLTGQNSSGKTTSLYAAILECISKKLNVITFEDSIEYKINGITQVQLNPIEHLTLTSAINVSLCQDTNIILIDEIIDSEGAQSTLRTSLGRLVISTLNAANVIQAAERLIAMNIEPFLLASSLILVVGQRLIKKICPKCKYPVEMEENIKNIFSSHAFSEFSKSKVDPSMENKLNDIFSKYAAHSLKSYYKGAGCNNCQNTGYDGYTAIFEFLSIDDELRKLITKKAASSEINAYAVKKGMDSMLSKGLSLVAKGVTTPDQVIF